MAHGEPRELGLGVARSLLAAAAGARKPTQLNGWVSFGSVGAAVLASSGRTYLGVCIDTACSLGQCAESSAVAAVLTSGDTAIVAVAAVMADVRAGPPCGRCRELLSQLGGDPWVLLDGDGRVRLSTLLPEDWKDRR